MDLSNSKGSFWLLAGFYNIVLFEKILQIMQKQAILGCIFGKIRKNSKKSWTLINDNANV